MTHGAPEGGVQRRSGGPWWRLLGASPLLIGALWVQWWWGATALAMGLLVPGAFVCARRRWLQRTLLAVGLPYLAVLGAVLGSGLGSSRYALQRHGYYEAGGDQEVGGARVGARSHVTSWFYEEPRRAVLLPGLRISRDVGATWDVGLVTEDPTLQRVRVVQAELRGTDGRVHRRLDLRPLGWIPFEQPVEQPGASWRRAVARDLQPGPDPTLADPELWLVFELDRGGDVSAHSVRVRLERRVERASTFLRDR